MVLQVNGFSLCRLSNAAEVNALIMAAVQSGYPVPVPVHLPL